jgi:Gnt-I system high-affinity gluconate transporter
MDDYAAAIKDVALIVLIVGGAGGLKEVMIVSVVNETIVGALTQINIHTYL